MKNSLAYPPEAEVDAADIVMLRYWLNELPGSPHDSDWDIMQRIIRRLRELNRDPYTLRPAKTLQAAEKPIPKPRPKPLPQVEAAPAGYFKSLFP